MAEDDPHRLALEGLKLDAAEAAHLESFYSVAARR